MICNLRSLARLGFVRLDWAKCSFFSLLRPLFRVDATTRRGETGASCLAIFASAADVLDRASSNDGRILERDIPWQECNLNHFADQQSHCMGDHHGVRLELDWLLFNVWPMCRRGIAWFFGPNRV